MTTLTVRINEKSKLGKAIVDLLHSSAKESKAVELVENSGKSPYSPEFVKMVLQASKSKQRIKVDPKNLWESIK
jgi:hypothetical protein